MDEDKHWLELVIKALFLLLFMAAVFSLTLLAAAVAGAHWFITQPLKWVGLLR